jgi:N-acyl-D-aspartate/D-glutamate deacylase
MPEFDLVVRGGQVVDGSGGQRRTADVAVHDGTIVEVGRVDGGGRREIDADGAVVAPGFVDIHTHYDGQASWSSSLAPSVWHGVTTVVMGNCGVGFAPVRPSDHERLIDLMEGVEDIPGTALHAGLQWDWDSFPSYLDALSRRAYDVDIAAQVPHAPLRLHVMGERAARREEASAHDVAEMARLAAEGVRAGALGFSTSSTLNHRTRQGELTPTYAAAGDELVGIASALGETGTGVLQLISDFDDPEAEFAILRQMMVASRRPLSVSLLQNPARPDLWRNLLTRMEAADSDGLTVRAQVAARAVGVLYGLSCRLHPLAALPSFQALGDLSLAEKVVRMADHSLRDRVLAEAAAAPRGMANQYDQLFEMGDPPDYEPEPSTSLAQRAARSGSSPEALTWDLLQRDGGATLLYAPVMNYVGGNLDAVGEMLAHRLSIPGLSDGGAHVGVICDASFPTTLLSLWGRDRSREGVGLEHVVARQARATAQAVGLNDRGLLSPGYRADLNVIDLPNVQVRRPFLVADLPAGASRFEQRADGYLHTIVGGVETYAGGRATGALPGRLVRGPQRPQAPSPV